MMQNGKWYYTWTLCHDPFVPHPPLFIISKWGYFELQF